MKPGLMKWTVAGVAALMTLSACGSSTDPTSEGSEGGEQFADLVTPGTLTICSDVPFPPFEMEAPDTELGYSGFDMDIVTAITNDLGLGLEVVDVEFNSLQSGAVLVSRQCDMGASALTVTDERRESLDFTDGYYDSLQSLLVRTDSGITDLNGLAGKNIGVQSGTTGKNYTEENAPADATITELPSDGELWPALQAGQIDAILQDLPVNLEHEKADPAYKIVARYETDEQYAFAFAKGEHADLREAVNTQLQKMRDDGRYDEIYSKYFEAN
jgi:polar amino acid transport system substrate-binding protein